MLIVVPCCQAKSRRPGPAVSLYRGALFRARVLWAKSVAPRGQIRILSARYGLVRLDDELEPYDQVFTGEERIAAEREDALLLANGEGVYFTVLKNSGMGVRVVFGAKAPPNSQQAVLKARRGQTWPWRNLTDREKQIINAER